MALSGPGGRLCGGDDRDGSTHVVPAPLDFTARQADLVETPTIQLRLYHADIVSICCRNASWMPPKMPRFTFRNPAKSPVTHIEHPSKEVDFRNGMRS